MTAAIQCEILATTLVLQIMPRGPKGGGGIKEKLEKQWKREESSTALNNFCRLAPNKASKINIYRKSKGGETKEFREENCVLR